MKLKPLSYLDIKVNMFITKLRVRKTKQRKLGESRTKLKYRKTRKQVVIALLDMFTGYV